MRVIVDVVGPGDPVKSDFRDFCFWGRGQVKLRPTLGAIFYVAIHFLVELNE